LQHVSLLYFFDVPLLLFFGGNFLTQHTMVVALQLRLYFTMLF
jgi:hypothetical protein